MSKNNTSDVHISYHSGTDVINRDYSGSTGTMHYHGKEVKWTNNPDAGGETLYRDSDGGFKYSDGTRYKQGGK